MNVSVWLALVGGPGAEVGRPVRRSSRRPCPPRRVWSAPLVKLGVSFTAATLKVRVFGEGSRSTPPLAVPPLSCTWKVNEVYGVPLPLAPGWKTSRPAAMLAAETYWPVVTVVPLSFTVPAAGSVVIFTARSVVRHVPQGVAEPEVRGGQGARGVLGRGQRGRRTCGSAVHSGDLGHVGARRDELVAHLVGDDVLVLVAVAVRDGGVGVRRGRIRRPQVREAGEGPAGGASQRC